MDNKDFCQLLGRVWLSSSPDTKDYVPNPDKYEVLKKVQQYCEDLCSKTGATIDFQIESKKDCKGEITVRFTNDLTLGDPDVPVKDFVDAMTSCDALCISGTGLEDGSFLISFLINDLFIKPENK